MAVAEGETLTLICTRGIVCHSEPSTCSVDPVDYLPNEILWKIIGFLSVEDLCHLAVCSKAWRNVTNTNSLWLHLCKLRDWERFGTEVDLRKEKPIQRTGTSTSGTSPAFRGDSVITGDCNLKDLAPTCEWKEVYMRAWHLDRNWSEGRYREHRVVLSDHKHMTDRASDGRTFAAGDQFGYLRLWDLNSGCLLQKIQLTKSIVSVDQLNNPPYYGAKESIRKMILKNNIGVAAFIGGILIFESTTGNVLKMIRGTVSKFDELSPRDLHFEDNKVIASYEFPLSAESHESTSVHIWDISGLVEGADNGTCTETKLCTDSLRSGVLTKNYLRCFACCKHFVITSFEEDDTAFILWDTRTLRHVRIYKGHTDMVRWACLDENTIMTANHLGGEVKIWTTESDICMRTLSTSPTNRIHTLLFNDNSIAALSITQAVFWSRDGTLLTKQRSKVKWTGRIHGGRLVTQKLYNNMFCVWNVSTGKCLYRTKIGPEELDLIHSDDTKIVFYKSGTLLTLQYL